ncbi:zinc finger FYVE domain-containing protein 26 homolog [Scaptodrosophila lebanonensis]|uniref:Zinc finger FYVE domain-containing protein 26 homolog n=1 Tax=Drosophila lebanonensis TaxID=7225 RepID=A0A6J2TLS1_DROLE|nr:zinc finger FYVE domain-containing protein 26 homolog [Scaptodrosophila lebanonensis]
MALDTCPELRQLMPLDQQELIESFLKSPNGRNERLQALLLQSPYPILQILNLFYNRAKFNIGRVISAALHEMLDNDALYESPQFINMLANFPQQIMEALTLQQKLLDRLQRDCGAREELLLALLARQDEQLLNQLLRKSRQALWMQCNDGLPNHQLVLQLALTEREHFVPRLCKQLKDFHCIQDYGLRNNLLILKLADEFALGGQTVDQLGYIEKALAAFNLSAVPPELQEIHHFFYADFQRLSLLLAFLRQHEQVNKTLRVEALLRAPGVLTLIHDQGIICETKQLMQLIEDTYKWQQKTPALKCVRTQELETLSYYTALCHTYDVIMEEQESTRETLLQLSTQLRQLRSLGVLCAIMEDILHLVFLRWEQLEARHMKNSNAGNGDDDDDDDDEQYVDDEATPPAATAANHSKHRYGFICRAPSIHALFTYLKSFVTKKRHTEEYKCATEETQFRFQRISGAINEALWKYSVLQKIEKSLTKSMNQGVEGAGSYLGPEQLLQLIQLHNKTREKASSDDESGERLNFASSLTRRKSKKQRRASTFSGATASTELAGGSGLTLEQHRARANKMRTDLSDGLGKYRKLTPPFTERSIIPKMLCTPEQLAIIALALKNFSDVKYIIETFHLEHSHLKRDLQFMEQQQLIKEKLSNIYANYMALEDQRVGSNTTTVEQIKSVAAKGFELSKIISVVENFAQEQRLHQSVEVKQLLQRHAGNSQYAFLRQYEERNLNALIIADLIVNLRFNREITSNLLLVIRRQQQIHQSSEQPEDVSTEPQPLRGQKTQLPMEIGAMTLLENLCECMRVLERDGRQAALSDLLSRHCYTLKPQQLALELQREAAFNAVYYKKDADYAHCQDLRAHILHFQQLKSRHNYYARFCNYVHQLARLLQLRDANLEYHTTQLLKHDPYIVIGELIYDCDMTPLEIESNVAALNLSLVHVIALNICPQLMPGVAAGQMVAQRSVSPQKKESIHNYLSQHNQLLAHLLETVQLGHISVVPPESGLNFAYLHELIELNEIDTLAKVYNGNRVVSALHSYKLDSTALEHLVESPLLQLQIQLLGISGTTESFKVREERIDGLIGKLIEMDGRNITLVTHMSDIVLRARLLQEHFTKIPTTNLAKELIERTLQHRQASQSIPNSLRKQLEHTLSDITIYARVSTVLEFETWPQAYDFGRKTPNVIFEQLLQRQLFELCHQWCQVVQLTTAYAAQQRTFLLTLLDSLLEVLDDVDEHLLRIIELFPATALVNFLDTHKDKLRSLELMEWVINFLVANARNARVYRNYRVSLMVCRQLGATERQHFWHLLRYPLLIIEQLLLNAKFELLAKVMPAARTALQKIPAGELCPYCFDKRGHNYDVQATDDKSGGVGRTGTPIGKAGVSQKVRFQLGHTKSETFILLNFNLYQQDHIVGNDCFDLLLRIYASKALDYHIADVHSEQSSISTDLQNSLDSLCGAFQIPKQAPSREHWVRDEEASHCMCCKRAAFTMLMRRHHCRRCGRVVCYACSTQRMKITELYGELEVRVCNECMERCASELQPPVSNEEVPALGTSFPLRRSAVNAYKWRLSGIITHDKLLREEFCYEHAPSVALSLSILNHHQSQLQCVEFLLFHCRKLEKLIVPNPEVDYDLVAKMMNVLALAAKVRGAPGDLDNIREHSEIVMAVVQQGCESLIPPGPLSDQNLRKLADALVEAEHWSLALEVHLKFGFATTGVMAAHGMACLRAGCYDAAREKFAHCMTRVSNEQLNSDICKHIFSNNVGNDLKSTDAEPPPIKRPQRGPALLQEVLKLIASIPLPHIQQQPETLKRASLVRNSNTSLASLFSRRKEPHVPRTPLHEPALNVMNALASLKQIAKGNYGEHNGICDEANRRQSRRFEESLHYVLTYGSHADILQLLMQQNELRAALKYLQHEKLETDHFIQQIFQPSLAIGQLPVLIEEMQQLDDVKLSSWRLPLLQTCRHLEQQQQLNSLYQLQLLLKDPIRASMTCVKFYALNCDSFQKLHANAEHLRSAHMHLQSELDASQWDVLQREQQPARRTSTVSVGSTTGACFAMQMDARALNSHINTIRLQMEVAKFLAKCEKESPPSNDALITQQILKQIRLDSHRASLPTLFEGPADKIQLCILVLLCGKNIDVGFGLAYSIIQDYKLAPMKVFGATAKYLARNKRLAEVDRLLNCIASNNGGSSSSDTDELLSIAINAAVQCHEPETKQLLDSLAKRISNVELRISSHIFIGQLKSAYLLANKYDRLADIRKILRQAELTNQIHIKKLCEKKLNIHSKPMAPTPL